MRGEDDRGGLIRVADQLAVELGSGAAEGPPGSHSSPGDAGAIPGPLDRDDEVLATELRQSLARVAMGALGGGGPRRGPDENAVGAALDAVEMVTRAELATGNAGRLPALLPGFVFLVTLPVVDQDRALELSNRCSRLVVEHLYDEAP